MTVFTKGRADFLELGSFNAQCYRCGCKRKASEMRKQWQGYYVCPEHWEPRQAQDFVKGIPDQMAPPWVQPPPADIILVQCTLLGQQGCAGFSIAGCAISGRYDPQIIAEGQGVI
jgi:hypothetical protein